MNPTINDGENWRYRSMKILSTQSDHCVYSFMYWTESFSSLMSSALAAFSLPSSVYDKERQRSRREKKSVEMEKDSFPTSLFLSCGWENVLCDWIRINACCDRNCGMKGNKGFGSPLLRCCFLSLSRRESLPPFFPPLSLSFLALLSRSFPSFYWRAEDLLLTP